MRVTRFTPWLLAVLLLTLSTATAATARRLESQGGIQERGIPGVVDCGQFPTFYDQQGHKLRDAHGMSWEAQLCEQYQQSRAREAQKRVESSGSNWLAGSGGLNCSMVRRYYDERGVLRVGTEVASWEAMPCASLQRGAYLRSLGK